MDPLSAVAGTLSLLVSINTVVKNLYKFQAHKDDAQLLHLRYELHKLQITLRLYTDSLGDSNPRLSDSAQENLNQALLLSQRSLYELAKELPEDWQLKSHLRWALKAKERTVGVQIERLRAATLALEFALLQNESQVLKSKKLVENLSSQIETSRLEALHDEISSDLLATERDRDRAILDWLASSAYEDKHAALVKSRAPGTGQWLFDDSKFRTWMKPSLTSQRLRSRSRDALSLSLDEGQANTLWCHGPPGSGKSVLMSSIIEHLRNQFKDDPSVAVAYFYINQQTSAPPRALVGSLLRQLCHRGSALPTPVVQLWERSRCNDANKRLETKADEHYEDVMAEFFNLAGRFRQTFVCLDGLDEYFDCSTALCEIIRRFNKSHCSLLAASRDTEVFRELFNGYPHIDVRATRLDIESFIHAELEKYDDFRSNRDLEQQISKTIVQKSDSNFLFAAFQMRELLDQTSVCDIRQSLNALPSNTEDIYRHILARCEQQPRNRASLAKRVLMWLSYASRPLTVVEIQHAVAIDLNASEWNQDRLPPAHFIQDVCMGFVTVDPIRQLVLLRHASLTYYLNEFRDKLFSKGGAIVATGCLLYLTYTRIDEGPTSTLSGFQSRLKDYPFLQYCAYYWGTHIRQFWQQVSDTKQEEASARINSLLHGIWNSVMVLSSLTQLMFVKNPESDKDVVDFPEKFSCLHFAAYFDSSRLLQNVLMKPGGGSSNDLDTWYRSPLHIACERGNLEVVEALLLDLNTQVDAPDRWKRLPIHYAAIRGNVKIVSLILSRYKGDMNCQDSDSRTPLDHAAYGGHRTVLQILLERGADPDSGNTLLIAASGGHSSIVELLLVYGAEAGEEKAMHAAAKCGYDEIVGLLLQRGAFIDSRDEDGMTALHHAACTGRPSMADFLLVNGADVQAKDKKGNTALYLAAQRGDERTVKLLIERGAAIEARTDDGKTALYQSAANGNDGVVDFLLRQGATVDSASSSSSGPSDSTVNDTQQENALQAAAWNGHASVVKLLLDNHAEVDGKGLTSRTPLSYAAENGQDEVAKVLLQAGADPNATDGSGKTAIAYAQSNGHESTASLLKSGTFPSVRSDFRSKFMNHEFHTKQDVVQLLKQQLDVLASLQTQSALTIPQSQLPSHMQ